MDDIRMIARAKWIHRHAVGVLIDHRGNSTEQARQLCRTKCQCKGAFVQSIAKAFEQPGQAPASAIVGNVVADQVVQFQPPRQFRRRYTTV